MSASRPEAADRLSVALMLTLSFGTGILDAATYLGLHEVFTANMTGNVVFVGLGLAGAEDIPLFRALSALGGFVVGATMAGLLQRGRESSPNTDRVATGLLFAAATVVGTSAVLLHHGGGGAASLDAITGALGWAMGAQAVAARRVAVGDVSTVVVTSTLAGLFAEAPWTGGTSSRAATMRRGAAVLVMGSGAVAGAFALKVGLGFAVGLSAIILLAVAVVKSLRIVRTMRTRATSRP